MLARWKVVDENFTSNIQRKKLPLIEPLPSALPSQEVLLSLFDSQLKSRHLDLIARTLKENNQSFYTIGSSGHEGNAVLGVALPYADMAFLHYRSGAFFIERAKQIPGLDPVRDILLSLICAKADPVCSGRHKVFGSKLLNIPPQTSTIASHAPKAFGAAMAITRQKTSTRRILCSFGDASFNHSTLQGSLNSAQWMAHARYPLPLLFVCEDNGIGISTPTPANWIKAAMAHRPGIHYLEANGLNLAETWQVTQQAIKLLDKQQPVFLHLKVCRLMGHAGSDVEQHYWSTAEIEANEQRDPLLHSAALLIELGILTPEDCLNYYEDSRQLIHDQAQQLLAEPKLNCAEDVMEGIIPPAKSKAQAQPLSTTVTKHPLWKNHAGKPLTLAQQINLGLAEILARYPKATLFGEDVGKKGGVYRVTADLQKTFGQARVFDTLLDEQTILGMAMGFALQGFVPIPEIQFLAYLHNAEDQLRGEAATLPFFSNGQYSNPMLLRLPGLAYQKGFGGHYHNDNAIGFLREIPGLVIACPATGQQAVKLMRTCIDLVANQNRVVVFLEPIALYHEKDSAVNGDKQWLSTFPAEGEVISFGEVETIGSAQADLVILTYGNGRYLAQQAMHDCYSDGSSNSIKIVDLCWLSPLPFAAIQRAIQGCKHLIIVDECRKKGSLSEELTTWFVEQGYAASHTIQRITGHDCFIPLGKSWQYVLPSRENIAQTIKETLSSPAFSTESTG